MSAAPFQLFDPLRDEEYEALKADIARRGVMVPIEVDENGTILDGHHRHRICDELGIDPPTVVRSGLDEAAKVEHVLALNLKRRHLGPVAWAAAFRQLAQVRGVELNGNHNRHTPRAATVAALASEVGVKPRTVRHRLKLADDLAGHPDLAEKVDQGEMEAKRAHRVIRERAAEQRRRERVEPVTATGNIEVRHGDFASVLNDIEPGAVAAVITDPPYGNHFVEPGGLEALGSLSARLLSPAGNLALMFGNAHMDRAVLRLHTVDGLHYRGLIVWRQPGAHAYVNSLKTSPTCKPVLLYDRGTRERWLSLDYIESSGREKDGHHWQQNLDGFRRLVELLTRPGDLVVDPCLGAGTTALACRDLGRRFIGCDLDADAVLTARERLAS